MLDSEDSQAKVKWQSRCAEAIRDGAKLMDGLYGPSVIRFDNRRRLAGFSLSTLIDARIRDAGSLHFPLEPCCAQCR